MLNGAYLNAIDALYGDDQNVELPKPKIKKKKRPKTQIWASEEKEQMMLATWLTKNNIRFYAIPNGGYRHFLEAVKLKACGVSPGVPDICLPIARKGFHSLYIELKREKGGIVSQAQQWWLHELTRLGHKAIVCHGFNEAKENVVEYLK